MTALKKYERLEAIGLWRENREAQLREVVVSFGAASLVLSDQNDMPLAHWSLAAVRVLNGDNKPTVYAPDQEADETLEIDDALMVDAIAKVRDTLQGRRSRPGRLRLIFGGVLLSALVAFIIFALPTVSANYVAKVVPEAQKRQIGQNLLAQTNRLIGHSCDAPLGIAALDKMRKWLLSERYQLHVVDMGARFSTHLPGKQILINKSLLEDNSGPEVAAGFVLMELALAQETSPIATLFNDIGTLGTLTFLANGTLQETALAEFAAQRLSGQVLRPDDDKLLVLFAIAGLTSSPFAHALGNDLGNTQALLDGDPVAVDYQPVLSDGDWIALQAICSN